jgi:hypothetical protein
LGTYPEYNSEFDITNEVIISLRTTKRFAGTFSVTVTGVGTERPDPGGHTASFIVIPGIELVNLIVNPISLPDDIIGS